MPVPNGGEEREVLDRFLESPCFQIDLGLEASDVEIQPHPKGFSSPPDFCLESGRQRRVAVEILQAYLEDEKRELQTRKHAE